MKLMFGDGFHNYQLINCNEIDCGFVFCYWFDL